MSDDATSPTPTSSASSEGSEGQVEAPAEKPRPVRRRKTYTLQAGDNPSKVAKDLYGKASMGVELFAANSHVRWVPGTKIDLI